MDKYIRIILDSAQAKSNADALDKSVENVGKSADKTTFSMNKLASAIAGVITAREIANYSSTWTDLVSRTRNAIDAQEDALEVMERIADVARRSYGPLEGVSEVFLQSASSLTELGYSTQTQLDLTESLSLALVISGSKAERATVAINAFSRAMANGTLAGEDFNVINRSGGEIINAMSRALGVGVNEMRNLAREGKIGRKEMSAIVNELENLRQVAETMPETINDAFLILRNNAIQTVGTLADTTGAAQELAKSIILVADNLDVALDVAVMFTALMVSKQIPAIVLYTKSKMAQIAADQLKLKTDLAASKAEVARISASAKMVQANLAQAKSTEAIAAAQTRLIAISNSLIAAKGRLNAAALAYARGATLAGIAAQGLGRALSFVGGPMGAIFLAATALLYFTRSADDAADATKELTKSVENMTAAQAKASKNNLQEVLSNQEKQMREYAKNINWSLIELEKMRDAGVDPSERFLKRLEKEQGAADDLASEIREVTGRIKELDSVINSGGQREIIQTNVKNMSVVDDVIWQIERARELVNEGFRPGEDPFADSFDFDSNGITAAMKRGTETMRKELDLRKKLSQIYIDGYHSDLRSQWDNERAQLQAQELEREAQLIAQNDAARQNRLLAKQQLFEDNQLLFEERMIIEQEYQNQEKLAAEILEEELSAIRQKGVNDRKKIDDMERKARMNSFASLGNALMALGENQSRKVFEIGKAAALAQAAVSLPSSILESYNNSGGYPWGIPAAIAMGAIGLKNISDIKNAKFGSTPSTSVQSAAPTPEGAPAGGGGPAGNFTLAGFDPRALYTGEQLQNMGNALQDWWKNGGGDGNMIYQR